LRQFIQCDVKVLINNNIFAFWGVCDLASGVHQPTSDHRWVVLTTRLQACFERFERGRQDENTDCGRQELPDLPGTLPIDFEYDVLPGLRGGVDGIAWGAVEITVYLGPFE